MNNVSIITVSNHSKYNMLTFYPDCKKDINVFYSPDVTAKQINPNPEFNINIDFKGINYFLLICGNRWTKNNLISVQALDELFTERKYIKHKVIITGVNKKSIYYQRIKNKDKFYCFNYVNEDILNGLYKNAFALIYMTLNEGFGYPPLEAMKYKVPVISSPLTSLTEICGDAVLYADPYSVIEIKNRILQLILDGNCYKELQEKGTETFFANSKEAGKTFKRND